MPDLCTNCGHALPNAVGVGIYCTHCGEPVKPKQMSPLAHHRSSSAQTDKYTLGQAIGEAIELLVEYRTRLILGTADLITRRGITKKIDQVIARLEESDLP